MNLDDLDIAKLMKRLADVERIDVGERLDYIEKQLKHFVFAVTEMKERFVKGIAVNIDQSSVNIAIEIRHEMFKCFDQMRSEACAIGKIRKEMELERHKMSEMAKNETIVGTLKFMAQRLNELVEEVAGIKENGIKKKIELDLTLDGYEMVRRNPRKIEDDIQKIDPEAYTNNILKTLTIREGQVLIHRFGLLGEKAKTLEATGKILGVTREIIRQVQMKALRKCRHPSRAHLARDLTHKELRLAILGE